MREDIFERTVVIIGSPAGLDRSQLELFAGVVVIEPHEEIPISFSEHIYVMGKDLSAYAGIRVATYLLSYYNMALFLQYHLITRSYAIHELVYDERAVMEVQFNYVRALEVPKPKEEEDD